MKPAFLLLAALLANGAERRAPFNADWRFLKGDVAAAQSLEFDDSSWRQLNLPHDWAIEGPFDRNISPHQGSLPFFGTAWYRKQFTLPDSAKASRIFIEFDGAMANSTVWINGVELGGRPYGYIGFTFDLTPHLRWNGQKNVIAVRLAPEPRSSRWYPGAGLYRNVWLVTAAPVHIPMWGTYVPTTSSAGGKCTVTSKTEISNQSSSTAKVTLHTTVLDPSGRAVAKHSAVTEIASGATASVRAGLTVDHEQLWDTDHPQLYTLVSEVRDGRHVVDRYTTPFGIRTIAFDKAKGFLLNGRPLKLHGVCLHHDLGALGAAVNRRATERQLEILRSMGANAIRTSHNPPSPELLELCDRMGFLVIDEAFDMWRRPKNPNDYHKYFDQWAERDARDMIRRDRNHPSVILWSIGNEIPEQHAADGAKTAAWLTGIFHEEDPTRPTTSAFDAFPDSIKNGLAAAVDVPGFNYKPFRYGEILKDHPDWVIYGSETSSCVSSRGVYHLPLEKYEKHPSHQLTSYDILSPPWAYLPDPEFEAQDALPQVLGEFVWTGFDYLGEPTPYFMGPGDNAEDWPVRSSYFGIVDLAGFPKDRYYLYQSVWTTKPMVHILPHWNWAGHEGQMIPVMAYTNAEEVELFLNGKSLGRKKRGAEPVELPTGKNISPDLKFRSKYRLMWQVPYAPGAIKAVAYSGGKPVAEKEIRTAGAPARIRLLPDRTQLTASGDDLSFITVRIEDQNGNLCPESDNLVRFKVEGAGSLAAVDNGNAATLEPFQADNRKAFNGLALLIVRTQSKPGTIEITAASEGLAPATAKLTTRAGNQ